MLRRLLRALGWQKRELRILQWNCNGIRPKAERLKELLSREQIDIAVIQETHLKPRHSFSLGQEYVIHRKDRTSHKGGVMTIFSTRIASFYTMHIRPPEGVEGQSWILRLSGMGVIVLHNWYLPPGRVKSRTTPFTLQAVQPHMRKSAFLLGDFNCKSPWWGYKGTDSVGRAMQALVKDNSLVFLNQVGVSTLRRQGTVPDLSLVTEDLARNCEWRTGDSLGSDHSTIQIVLNMDKVNAGVNRVVPVIRKRKYRRKFSLKRLGRNLMWVVKYAVKFWDRKPRRLKRKKTQ